MASVPNLFVPMLVQVPQQYAGLFRNYHLLCGYVLGRYVNRWPLRRRPVVVVHVELGEVVLVVRGQTLQELGDVLRTRLDHLFGLTAFVVCFRAYHRGAAGGTSFVGRVRDHSRLTIGVSRNIKIRPYRRTRSPGKNEE